MEKELIHIGIIGDFSVGKSSLLNFLMGADVLDTDINPTTSVIYKVYYSENEFERDLKEIWNGVKIEIYEFGACFEMLKDFPEVVLWDTPGLNSSERVHEVCIDYAMEHIDGLILVVDCAAGTIKHSSFEKIKKCREKPVAVLFSKIDKITQSQREAVLTHVKNQVENFLEKVVFYGFVSIYQEETKEHLKEAIAKIYIENLLEVYHTDYFFNKKIFKL